MYQSLPGDVGTRQILRDRVWSDVPVVDGPLLLPRGALLVQWGMFDGCVESSVYEDVVSLHRIEEG